MRFRALVISLLAWLFVWAFWLVMTRHFHPTSVLALIVTSCLVAAYAAAAYINHLIMLPRLWPQHRLRYACWLGATMVALTGIALTIIRVSYAQLWGPDADQNGAYKHFAIDLFGMAVHLAAAALVVRAARLYGRGAERRFEGEG
jgi:hypothetical protein